MREFKTLKPSKTFKAAELDYLKRLKYFSNKVNASMSYWLYLASKQKWTAKQISKKINTLQAYWNKKANDLSKTLPKRYTKSLEKFLNVRLKKQNKEWNLKESSRVVQNEMNAILERNAALIKTIPSDIIERYRSDILNNVANLDQEAIINHFKTFSQISERRMRVIARDQTQKAINDLQNAKAQQLGFEYYIWRTSGDSRVSEEHKRLNGRIYSFKNPTAVIDSYGNVGHTAQRVNCLPRGQGIDFANMPLRIFRSKRGFNEATIIRISLDNGGFLTTSDHKVLTSSGWVAADTLNKGDYIIQTLNNSDFTSDIDFYKDSIIISNLFDFFRELIFISSEFSDRLTFFRVGAAGNFYKDIGSNEKIYIIDIECFLRDCNNIIFNKFLMQDNFSDSAMRINLDVFISCFFSTDSSFNFLFNAAGATPNFIVGVLSYLLSIINGGILKANDIRLTSVSDFIIHIFEPLYDNRPRNTEQIRNLKNAIAQNIIILNFFCAYMFIVAWQTLNRNIVDNSSIPIKDRKTEKVRIENIERLKMDTHIYSLECDNGYYTIKGTINKNCRCYAEPILLEPTQEVVLKHDSKAGDYYEIRKKQ
ncbi:minor capsid protein [Helicobacter sp. MIT 05-5294]|uniref:minor capsid protein n=1 Tax=Helicobacter sp. MIT 05-5294 TaxID=1548150 RepID=UPI0010FD234A|nr:minor capsid protein [Helicobacter sp. MIT 05-5294]TLD85816.1 hypothetical protein LS69_007930 [Helicobacter sp. MIT 05-5294]